MRQALLKTSRVDSDLPKTPSIGSVIQSSCAVTRKCAAMDIIEYINLAANPLETIPDSWLQFSA